MKYLIILLTLLTISLTAQNKKNYNKEAIKNQTGEWMDKLSSTPEMREAMLVMILDKAKGDDKEIAKLGKTILGYPVMNSAIAAMSKGKRVDYINAEPRGVMGDSAKSNKMLDLKSIPMHQNK